MQPDVVILGWDSATFDVVDPLIDSGRLPSLAALRAEGFSAPLQTTWPPMTDSAWTSAFTGRNPGAHGIFGSWYRAPGDYACRYFASGDRLAPALWELVDDRSFVVWNVPMTYPPTPLDGAMVAGYGAPPGARFCRPDEVQDELSRRWRIDALLDKAPRGSLERFLDSLIDGLVAQTDALIWLAEKASAECVVAVFPEIDRAQHFFWRFRASTYPLADAVDRVYAAMDAATGRLMAAWPDATFVVLSDHGAGRLLGDVNVGGWLASNGYAVPADRRSPALARLAWGMPPRLRRLGRRLAPGLARRTVAAGMAGQLGPFDWDRTFAFVGFHGDLWLNLEGRERRGMVAEGDAPALTDELCNALVGLRDPATDRSLFAAAHRRDSIYSGGAVALAPDVMLDSWSAGYRIAPTRGADEPLVGPPHSLSGVKDAWSADHRPTGILVAGGPRVASGRAESLSILDVTPTILALLAAGVPTDLDGRVLNEAIAPSWSESHPVTEAAPSGERARGDGAYSDEDAAAVAAHLRDLGYID